jgi:hypothetical protein
MAADDRIEHLIRFYSILDALEKNVGAPARVSLARVEMLSTFGRTELRIPQEGDFQQPQDVYINDQVYSLWRCSDSNCLENCYRGIPTPLGASA